MINEKSEGPINLTNHWRKRHWISLHVDLVVVFPLPMVPTTRNLTAPPTPLMVQPPQKQTQENMTMGKVHTSDLLLLIYIWAGLRSCDCLVTWFCYQMITKPGNKTATPPWPDPYIYFGSPKLEWFNWTQTTPYIAEKINKIIKCTASNYIISIPAWISYHRVSKVWNEIIYPFPNFNGATTEVCEWISNVIPHFIMDVNTYPC